MPLSSAWEFVSDRVMGGVSDGRIDTRTLDGRRATELTGTVSLDNDGGFVQMAFDLDRDVSLTGVTGLWIAVQRDGQTYELRLRTRDLSRPWQSFRATFKAPSDWKSMEFPFSGFTPHRTEATFDPAKLHRIGVVAIGRPGPVRVAVSDIGLLGAS